jgi:predicted N-acetyltransferase YhbS
MIIRQETEKDYSLTEQVVEEAFKEAEHASHDEHLFVHRIRESDAFIPELSLVAEIEDKIVGHILFSKMMITGHCECESLALAPVAVLPEYQRRGIGGKLIREGLRKAEELGYESVIVVGHKDYYPRFGFEKASKWGVQAPFEVPDEVFMAIELKKDALQGKSGVIRFAKEFGI